MSPTLFMDKEKRNLEAQMLEIGREFGKAKKEVATGIARRSNHRKSLMMRLKRGQEILDSLKGDNQAIVVIGKPYNVHDTGLNLNISKKLRKLGVIAMPYDLLPLDTVELPACYSNLVWKNEQNLLRSALMAKSSNNLNPIMVTNYGCWPDAFFAKYLEDTMGSCQAGASPSACGVSCGACSSCPAPSGGPCKTATCVAGQCGSGDKADGSTCDDGKFCTAFTTCTAGVCGGGSLTECSDSCNTGTCELSSDRCAWTPVANGTACPGGSCRKGTCCQTCYDGNNNCLAGTSNSACGTGNIRCVSCPSSKPTCVNFVCTCTGCTYGTGCHPGTAANRCGLPGGTCKVCPTAVCQQATCTAGACGLTPASDGTPCQDTGG